jgi:uncharacterized protein
MESVLITGGSGMIGSCLTSLLQHKGYAVSHLTRSPDKHVQKDVKQFLWDPSKKYIENTALDHDYIIHLAGAGIADTRWTEKRKQELYKSRVDTTRLLADSLVESNARPKAFISASGIGYYGAKTSKHPYSEKDHAGDDFLAKLCVDWENASSLITQKGIRTVFIRTPFVLSQKGGGLERLRKLASLNILSPLGTGQQYMPWIHISDLAQCYLFAMKNEYLQGPVNAVADDIRTNKEFTECLMKASGRKMLLPAVPEFVLKVVLGEIATSLTHGSPISNKRLKNAGFEFSFQTLPEALKNCIKG